jgi:hypothetical protein
LKKENKLPVKRFWNSLRTTKKGKKKVQSARIRLFLGLCSTSASPKASKIGGM